MRLLTAGMREEAALGTLADALSVHAEEAYAEVSSEDGRRIRSRGHYLRNYVQRVGALTPGDIQRLAKKYLRDQEMTIVVGGDREAILEQLKPFGSIR